MTKTRENADYPNDEVLRLEVDAGNQTVSSTGTTTFDGLVEAGGGVRVTGGDPASVVNGIATNEDGGVSLVQDSNSVINLVPHNNFRLTISPEIDGATGTMGYGCVFTPKISNSSFTNETHVLRSQPDLEGLTTPTLNYFSAAYLSKFTKPTVDRVYGFSVNSSLDFGSVQTRGFNSNLAKEDAKVFNFYANRDAPNFFSGDTYIGGTTSSNTRQLWESLLTEEQQEQLAAGTLAIPANVSTPGDGSFVRQWWYDQQSAEDQALIDAGELDYPERYQAANFVDTFALGDDTSIDLMSNGYVHQAGIKWKGGGSANRVDSKGLFNSVSRGTVVCVNSTQTANEQVRGIVTRIDTVSDDDGDPVNVGNAHVYVAETPLNHEAGKVKDWIGFSCNAPNDTFSTAAIDGTTYGFYSNINVGNGYNFYAPGSAPNYFKGLVESAGGVSVTGGSSATVVNGIYSTNENNFQIQSNNGEGAFLVKSGNIGFPDLGTSTKLAIKDTLPSGQNYLIGLATDIQCSVAGKNIFNMLSDFSSDASVPATYTGFFSRVLDAGGKQIADSWKGFKAEVTGELTANTVVGFESNIGTGNSTGNAYNFYAAGAAPNYFSGMVYAGSNTAGINDAGFTVPANAIKLNPSGQLQVSRALADSAEANIASFYATSSTVTTQGIRGSITTNAVGVKYKSNDPSYGPTFVVTSDARVKTHQPFTFNASDVVSQLNPGLTGFIAHELQSKFSDAVTGTQDETEAIGTLTDAEGVVTTDVTEPEAIAYGETWTQTGTRPVYQGVDQTKLIPLLTKALQEALERIEELESNTLQPLYSTVADLPSASDHHGKTAHVHSEGALYFAHAGSWVKLQNA